MQPLDKPPVKLLFQDASFISGIVQSTCRLGVKWADFMKPRGRNYQDVFVTGYEDHGRIGVAELIGCLTGTFAELAEIAAQTNHSELIRDDGVDGLIEAMQDAYGDQFTETSPVTVLFFKFSGDARDRVEEEDGSPDELLYGGSPGGGASEVVELRTTDDSFVVAPGIDETIIEPGSVPAEQPPVIVDAVSTTEVPPVTTPDEVVTAEAVAA